MRHVILAVAVAVASLHAAPAHANKRSQAMAQFEQGEKLYTKGKYEMALKAFQRAYKLEAVPLLFVNIAQCHRQLGNHEAAIASLERYLEAEPEADNRAEIEELLASERALLNPTPEPAPEPPPEPEPTPVVEPTPAPAALAAAPTPAANDDGDDDGSGTVMWVAIGGAALFAVVGGAAIAAVALQPAPAEPTGALGTFDLR